MTEKQTNFILIPFAIIGAAVLISAGVFYNQKEKAGNMPINNSSWQGELSPGTMAPDFSLSTAKGIEIKLSDMRGKPVVLVFWTTTCPYCAQELPDLKQFAQKYKNEISVIAIDYMESSSAIKKYEEEEKINFTIVIDSDGEIFKQYKADATPFHYFINEKGEISSMLPNYAPLGVLEGYLSASQE